MKKTIKILKKKLKNYNPKLKEECGVFGISNSDDAAPLTALAVLWSQWCTPRQPPAQPGFLHGPNTHTAQPVRTARV